MITAHRSTLAEPRDVHDRFRRHKRIFANRIGRHVNRRLLIKICGRRRGETPLAAVDTDYTVLNKGQRIIVCAALTFDGGTNLLTTDAYSTVWGYLGGGTTRHSAIGRDQPRQAIGGLDNRAARHRCKQAMCNRRQQRRGNERVHKLRAVQRLIAPCIDVELGPKLRGSSRDQCSGRSR